MSAALSSEIAIDKFIPIPQCGKPPKYPLRTMEIDDSFLVPCADTAEATEKLCNSLTSCIGNVKKNSLRDFTMRRVKGGIRVWRVDDALEPRSVRLARHGPEIGKKMRISLEREREAKERCGSPLAAKVLGGELKRVRDTCSAASIKGKATEAAGLND